jgi:hypothetical protein
LNTDAAIKILFKQNSGSGSGILPVQKWYCIYNLILCFNRSKCIKEDADYWKSQEELDSEEK